MSSNSFSLKRTQTDLPPHAPGPARHGSDASTSSSTYSLSSNSFVPSRTSTVSSSASIGSHPSIGHRRGKSEVNNTVATGTMMASDGSYQARRANAGATYENIRRLLRPLPQVPNVSAVPKKDNVSRHARSYTVDDTKHWKENRPVAPDCGDINRQENVPPEGKELLAPQPPPHADLPRPWSPQALVPQNRPSHLKAHHGHSLSNPAPITTTLTAPDLETFQKSSTGHLRTLSKFAKTGESEELALGSSTASVVGLHGRRRLKRADSVAPTSTALAARKKNTSAWTAGNWMDKQRQFIQAYEYLCHIGEAKEWIEEVIQKQIPPIVQLEEALRDGVTLAEIVQAMYPDRPLRIFRHPRLQYRHSDNIALFFRLLDEIELPELFRFELIDLYEKKNIPKVIHCIHALSWLLFKHGMLDFRMDNLVGQLEFEHHELEQTQKGLDKSGVSMPSFAGMAANFGAEPEPEPEPEESEEERIQRELGESETAISDFQGQIRGAMCRLMLGNVMNDLWDFEPLLVDLQARLRGDWSRQIVHYRLDMRNFAIGLQAACRGFLVRSHQQDDKDTWEAQGQDILQLQSLIRAAKARAEVKHIQTDMQKEMPGIKQIQAALRGALQRKYVCDVYDDTRDEEPNVTLLQAAIRAALLRNHVSNDYEATRGAEKDITALQAIIRGALHRNHASIKYEALRDAESDVISLQAIIRGVLQRDQVGAQHAAIESFQEVAVPLQAVIRGMMTRRSVAHTKARLDQEIPSIVSIQAGARALAVRNHQSHLAEALHKTEEQCVALQAMVRGAAIRENFDSLRDTLAQHTASVVQLQSFSRAMAVRQFLDSQQEALKSENEPILELQSFIRGALLRKRLEDDDDELREEEHMIVNLQALSRAALLRIEVGGILEQLEDSEDEITNLQALTRAMLVRLEVGQMLSDLEADEDIIIDMQARLRGHMVRSRFEEQRRYYRTNMEKVVKAQSVVRGRIQGQAYKSLTSGKNPPVGTVKGFVHLLNDSDFDFDEEIEFERLRKVVVQQVRQNELAEQYISQLDIKIALLVKNKITLDEVVKHQKHFGGHIGSLLPNTEISSTDPFDLKALNKASRKKLEHYQVLFFLLQTQSQYLARLFRRLREVNTPEKEYERIRHLMMGLFGYSQKRREEYYLVKLLARSAREEIESFNSLHEYLRCNSFWNKLFASYMKSPRDRKFLRDVLGPVVREHIVENPTLDLESDPIQIHRSSINNEELQTGRRSRRRPDIPREEAIRDPETRATFIQHLQDLRDIADQFFAHLEEVLYRMPFGVRYVAKEMYETLLSRFSSEDPGFILQTVGFWVWKNYFQPAVLEPERYGVIDRGMTQEQKRNLSEIAKVVAQVASGRLFGAENVYLQPLNSYIGDSIQRLGLIWGDCEFLSIFPCLYRLLTPPSDIRARCRVLL